MTMMLEVWSLNVVFLYTANFINVFVCIAIGEEDTIFLLVRVRRVKFFLPIRRFHECGTIASKHACVFDSYCKLTALHARTLGGGVHSCTKLFKTLRIRCRWHA